MASHTQLVFKHFKRQPLRLDAQLATWEAIRGVAYPETWSRALMEVVRSGGVHWALQWTHYNQQVEEVEQVTKNVGSYTNGGFASIPLHRDVLWTHYGDN